MCNVVCMWFAHTEGSALQRAFTEYSTTRAFVPTNSSIETYHTHTHLVRFLRCNSNLSYRHRVVAFVPPLSYHFAMFPVRRYSYAQLLGRCLPGWGTWRYLRDKYKHFGVTKTYCLKRCLVVKRGRMFWDILPGLIDLKICSFLYWKELG